jgi:hypothetical protein
MYVSVRCIYVIHIQIFFYWEDYSVKFVGKNNKEKKKNEERKE